MFFSTAADKRPYHFGPFPLETLSRDDAVIALEAARTPQAPSAASGAPEGPLGRAARAYLELIAPMADDDEAPRRAPVADDLERRAVDLKG